MVFGFVTNERTVLFSVHYTSLFSLNSEKTHACKEGQAPSLSDGLCNREGRRTCSNTFYHFCEFKTKRGGEEITERSRNQDIKGYTDFGHVWRLDLCTSPVDKGKDKHGIDNN